MSGNLPDGVSISDIPGNRPSDIRWDAWLDDLDYEEIAEHLASAATDSVPTWVIYRLISTGDARMNLLETLQSAMRSWLDSLEPEDVGRIGYALGCNPEPPE